MKTRELKLWKRCRLTSATAVGGVGLLLAGCGNDADDNYGSQDRNQEQERQVAAAEAQKGLQQMEPEQARVQGSAEIVLREEELNVEKRTAPAGGIVLRKKVVEEPTSETVQLRKEEIEVVRLSPEEARERMEEGTSAEFSGEFSEEEVFIPLMQEEAIAQKEVNTREVVQARTTEGTEEKQIQATLRSEELDTERVLAEDQDQYSAKQRFDESQSSDSEILKQRIRDRLQSEVELSSEQIDQLQIEVEEGAVTISGPNLDEQIQSRIRDEIQEIEGVASVELDL